MPDEAITKNEIPGLKNVTRLTIVSNKDGRILEKWDIDVSAFLQDDGQTLKVFFQRHQQQGEL